MNFSDLIRKIFKKEVGLDLSTPEHLELVKEAYVLYWKDKKIYEKMYNYYNGDTDAMDNYLFITKRSNLKVNTNFIKKFIKEEVAYAVGNDITYESRTDNKEVIRDIEYNTAHWSESHDSDLMKYLNIFTRVYELYYTDENADFCSRIIKPTDGYAYCDKITGKVLFFIHCFKQDFETDISRIDVFTDDYIYHFDDSFNEIQKPETNVFGKVPVTVGSLSEENYKDSLYSDMKGLQDAFETNLSDIGNEISDFRNAYLLFKGADIDKDDIPKMKEQGVIQFPQSGGDAEWLIKNINDNFVQNTLNRYEDTMYQLACHINHNEKMQSNLSGVALRSRLIALENKCSLLIKAHKDMIKNRLKFLFIYLDFKKNKKYDYKDIKLLYTPNIPSDDLSTAQMLSQVPDGILSKDTARGLFSFVNNKVIEDEKVKKEMAEDLSLGDIGEY